MLLNYSDKLSGCPQVKVTELQAGEVPAVTYRDHLTLGELIFT